MTILLSCAATIILEILITWYYCSKVFQPKYTRAARFLGSVASFSVLITVSLLESAFANIASFLVIIWGFIYFFYCVKWHSALFHSFLLTTIMTTTELFVSTLHPNHMFQFYDNVSVQGLVFIVFTSNLLYFLILRFISILIRSREQDDLHPGETISLCIIPFCSILLSITFTTISYSVKLSRFMNILVFISHFSVLLINLVIGEYYSYSQKRHHEFTQLQLQLQRENDAVEYYQLLLKQEEDKSILIHDIKKHLHSISAIIDTQSTQIAINYIEQLLKSSVLQSNVRVCDHDTANAVFSRYQSICQENYIHFEIDIRNNTLFFMQDNDITALFCNLLDNAIEASLKYPNGFISCNIRHKDNTPYVIITMKNSCRTAPVMDANNRIASTKRDDRHHGIGLKSIEKIVKKYNGHSKLYYDAEDHTFHTILTLHTGNRIR